MIEVSVQKCWHYKSIKLIVMLDTLGIRGTHHFEGLIIWSKKIFIRQTPNTKWYDVDNDFNYRYYEDKLQDA